MSKQPDPTDSTGPRIVDLVKQDLDARAEAGHIEYGKYLRAFNGRDALRDAYEEVLDLAQYLRQVMEEQRNDTSLRDGGVRSEPRH